jgi:hypothetical protein
MSALAKVRAELAATPLAQNRVGVPDCAAFRS